MNPLPRLILSCLLCLPWIAHAAAEKRPNILFILVDDQSPWDFKFYNPKSPLQSPNIDRLAAEGMLFDGAYHMGSFSGAVCTPSRHMIMTGRTVWHLPIGPGAKEHCPPGIVQNTIPAVFNRAGYATMRTCKPGNSYAEANKLFTVRHDASKRGGPRKHRGLRREPTRRRRVAGRGAKHAGQEATVHMGQEATTFRSLDRLVGGQRGRARHQGVGEPHGSVDRASTWLAPQAVADALRPFLTPLPQRAIGG